MTEIICIILSVGALLSFPIVLTLEIALDCSVNGEAGDGKVHLTFDEFRALYRLCNDRWSICPESLYYTPEGSSERVEITFLRIRDVLRYGKFAKKTEAQRLSARSDALKADLIKEVTKDAENLHRSAMKDLFRGAEAYAEIVRRCKKS